MCDYPAGRRAHFEQEPDVAACLAKVYALLEKRLEALLDQRLFHNPCTGN
jgi:hypothetical protein